MTTVILAEDHQVVREALRLLLETQADMRVLAEADQGAEAVRLVAHHQPEILITDLMMPGLSGLEVVRGAQRVAPATRVVVLSMYAAEGFVVEALQAGAAGYVLKKSSSQELIHAIRQVLAGHVYLSPALNERAVQAYIERSRTVRATDPLGVLTQRERQVFQLMAEGLTSRQMAGWLVLSVRTVEMHRSHLLQKLGLKTQSDLVDFVIQHGLNL